LKRKGLKIYFDHIAHICKTCVRGTEIEAELRELEKRHGPDVVREKEILESERRDILLHHRQLQVQRAEVTKIRENLNYDQCLLLEDFIGHYSDSSKNPKVYQLCFVLYYR
jgi:hypothetical protein